jgi:hypothetical protein
LATTSSSCHAQTDDPWPPRPDGVRPQNWPAHRLLAPMQPKPAATSVWHNQLWKGQSGAPAQPTDLVCQPLTPVGRAVCRGSPRCVTALRRLRRRRRW